MKDRQTYQKLLTATVSFLFLIAVSVFSTITNVEEVKAAKSFSDVSDDFWASGSIQRLADDTIISGYSDGTYRPGGKINRGQVAELLTAAFELEIKEKPDSSFNDLDDSSYFTPYAEAVREAGYITGRNDDTEFAAGMDLSREQMASILVRAFGFERIDDEQSIVTDIGQADPSHQNNIEVLAQHGVTRTEDGSYRPGETVTRAQFAKFLERAMSKAHTRDSGIIRVLAYDQKTVDVSFNREVGTIGVDDFSFDPSLGVLSAEYIEPEESFESNRGAQTVVRLRTGERNVSGYRLYYQGQRTDNVVVGSE